MAAASLKTEMTPSSHVFPDRDALFCQPFSIQLNVSKGQPFFTAQESILLNKNISTKTANFLAFLGMVSILVL